MIASVIPLGVDPLLQAQPGEQEALVSAVFVFLVSLLIGTVAINTGAKLLVDRDTGYRRAIITALVGAIVYTLVGFFLGGIPILGPLLMLIAWIGIINAMYPGGWATAAGIGFVAWIVAVLILFALAQIDIVSPQALGVPGS